MNCFILNVLIQCTMILDIYDYYFCNYDFNCTSQKVGHSFGNIIICWFAFYKETFKTDATEGY